MTVADELMMRAVVGDWERVYPQSVLCGIWAGADPYLDWSMTADDLITSTRRWMVVWSDRFDPRRKYFEGFHGWTGIGLVVPLRWDFNGTVSPTANHYTWHQRIEISPKYARSSRTYDALRSITVGDTPSDWAKQHG